MQRMTSRRLWASTLILSAACSGPDKGGSGGPGDDPERTSETTLAAMPQLGMCELPSGGYAEACNECLAASCCSEVEACKSDATCAAQLRCVIECQGSEDPGRCSVTCAEPGGFDVRYTAYDDCSFALCLSTCWM